MADMVRSDYTKEIGLQSGEKRVSKPVAIALFLVVIAGGGYLVSKAGVTGAHHHGGAAAAETPAHVPAAK